MWEDIDGPEDLGEGDEEPTYCEGCGRQLEYVVVWDDLIHNERKE